MEKLLSGINKKCKTCIEGCKQFKQVLVVQCPFYKKEHVETKIIDFSKHKNS